MPLLPRAQPRAFLTILHPRPFSSISPLFKDPTGAPWIGSKSDKHVTNSGDELDIQSGASKSGKRERAQDPAGQGSAAATEEDKGRNNKRAKKDNPEAPGPVIGMNDERGGKGH
ncbi:MAG: hypothetical protein MMC33_000806 [Icmadophila ericetorum]|nr:hypothetical protein [Icmadophila ericetorum]